ncbi:MAG: divalent metal cation transporter [Candidatus Aenigmarchaeota archaeon]|nr:divalent metal cation transporter [Candidatus Aenigmarchaeota archaeon]
MHSHFLSLLERRMSGKRMHRMESAFRKLKGEVGPGVITGGADNDPAGIVTYTTVGALYGYALLWVLILCTPLMIVVQEMAGRLALVKKKGLSSIIVEHYGKTPATVVMTSLLIVNIATIGADIAGVAAVLGLLTGITWAFYIIPVTALIGYLVLFKKYRFIRNILMMLTGLLVVYIFSSAMASPDWTLVVEGLVPTFLPSMGFVAAVVGVIGTTISPYMLFWQASDELEEHKSIIRPKEVEIDTAVGMSWSNMIAAFIIIAAASTLFVAGITVDTAEEAAMALAPLAGRWAFLLFSIGIIVSGFLALPVLAASSAFAVSETFGWREGLNKKVLSAKGFYFVFMSSLLVGSALAFLPINPIHFLYYTQVLDGFLTPFLALMLLFMCNKKAIMGKYTNNWISNVIGTALVVILLLLDVFLVGQIFGFL